MESVKTEALLKISTHDDFLPAHIYKSHMDIYTQCIIYFRSTVAFASYFTYIEREHLCCYDVKTLQKEWEFNRDQKF